MDIVFTGKEFENLTFIVKLMAWQWDRHSGSHMRTFSLAFMRRKYQERSIWECTFASLMTFSPTLRTKVGVLNFSNCSTVLTRRFVLHRKVNRTVLCPFLTWRCPELLIVSSRLCIINRRLPVAILRGTRSAQPAIRSTSCVHWRTGYFGFVHPLSSTRSWRPCGPFCQKMATLAISWRSWFQEIFLDVALVLDSVLSFLKSHGWEFERTDKLVRKANNAIRLAYFSGAVRPVYRITRAFSLPKNRIPTLLQSNLRPAGSDPRVGDGLVWNPLAMAFKYTFLDRIQCS